MVVRFVLRTGPLLPAVVAAGAAVACLSGQGAVFAFVGSVPLLVLVGLMAVGAILSAVFGLRRRNWAAALIHLGLVVGLAGVVLTQVRGRGGHQFLEIGAGSKDFVLDRDMRTVGLLPFALRLDSLAELEAPGFRPAPVAWMALSRGGSSEPAMVTYNRPLEVGGRRVMLLSRVGPGFPHEYEIAVGDAEYLVLHNQRVTTPDGMTFASFGYDEAERRLGVAFDAGRRWLDEGDSVDVDGTPVVLGTVAFASRPGVLLAVNDVRLRWLVYVGFGASLLGLGAAVLRREHA